LWLYEHPNFKKGIYRTIDFHKSYMTRCIRGFYSILGQNQEEGVLKLSICLNMTKCGLITYLVVFGEAEV